MTEQYVPPDPPPRSLILEVTVDPNTPDDTDPVRDDLSPDEPDEPDDTDSESADSEDGIAPIQTGGVTQGVDYGESHEDDQEDPR